MMMMMVDSGSDSRDATDDPISISIRFSRICQQRSVEIVGVGWGLGLGKGLGKGPPNGTPDNGLGSQTAMYCTPHVGKWRDHGFGRFLLGRMNGSTSFFFLGGRGRGAAGAPGRVMPVG